MGKIAGVEGHTLLAPGAEHHVFRGILFVGAATIVKQVTVRRFGGEAEFCESGRGGEVEDEEGLGISAARGGHVSARDVSESVKVAVAFALVVLALGVELWNALHLSADDRLV